MDAGDVDPSAEFPDLPGFLTEGVLLAVERMCQQLRLLLTDVPMSGVHGVCRKLQAHGHAKIAKQLRSLIQLEEALKVGRGQQHRHRRRRGDEEQGNRRVEQQQTNWQQRARTPGSSRPGSKQSMTILHRYQKEASALAESILVQQHARSIIRETKPANTERDREVAAAKISCWPAPRNTGFFLSMIEELLKAFGQRLVQSVAKKSWYLSLLQHQEERNTHANGDVCALKNALSELEAEKHESYAALDTTEGLLMGELKYARKSIATEEAFENGLQAYWEQQIG
eukprot:g59.t1